MIVFIPTHRKIHSAVTDSLSRYGHCLVPYTRKFSDRKHIDIGEKRNAIVRIARGIDDEYFCMNDSDVAHNQDNIPEMRGFLDANLDFALIALADCDLDKRGLQPNHVANHCIMMRNNMEYDFSCESPKECTCNAVAKRLRPEWKVGYLPGMGRIAHKGEFRTEPLLQQP